MSERNKAIDIPSEFFSFSSGTLFERCVECDKYLLEDNSEYFIEKAIKKYDGFSAQDVIFEYAICVKCAESMRKTMSTKSLTSMEQYFTTKIDITQRMNLVAANPNDPISWMDECLFSGTKKTSINEYQIYAHCNGNKLNTTQMPYMVSGAVLEEISGLLSPETLDELDDFSNRHFGPPPEFANHTPFRRVILI
jgi:hypothetical protein